MATLITGAGRIGCQTAALLAARAEPALAADVNFGGTVNLLEAARATGVRRFLLASSTTVYYPTFHRAWPVPIGEDFAFHAVSERPGSLYAASKLAAEFFTQHYGDQFGLSVGVLRYSAVLGLWAGPNNSVPGRLLAALLGQGAQGGVVQVHDPLLLWSGGDDFIDARDVARANVAALDAAALPSRVYTIGSGRLDSFAGFRHRRNQPYDMSRAQAELGFRAGHGLQDSLRDAARFVR